MSEGIRFEHYEVMRRDDGTSQELGRGAMGITYKALDTNLKQEVALKLINPSLLSSPEASDRFLEEARAAAQLKHPNIATILHVGRTEADNIFYTTEFCEGLTLDQAVKANGPLLVHSALQVTWQATKALVAAEEQHLIHRDIKPTNIILTGRPDDGVVVKLTDFGLARSLGDGRHTLATLSSSGYLGTAYFASPEQLEERDELDIRSDIYSLGACLWFMLTAQPPYAGPLALAMSRALLGELPLEKIANQPEPVINLLKGMLARNRSDRPPSAAALLADLKDCLRATEPPPPAPVVEEPPQPLPLRFQPVEEIGSDATGRLFRAVHHAKNGASVWYRQIDLNLTAVPATWRELQDQITAAHEHLHPNFINVITAESTTEGLAIIQDYMDGFSLADLTKARELTPQEVLTILQPLAEATDHAVKTGIRGLSLAKSQVFVHFPGGPEGKALPQIALLPQRQWPPYEIRANIISLGEAEAASHGFVRDPAVGKVGDLAGLAYELLGGQPGDAPTPLPGLSEATNAQLISACTEAGAYPTATAFVEALRESINKRPRASARRPYRPTLTPPPRTEPELELGLPPAVEPEEPEPRRRFKLGLTQWLILIALAVIFTGDGIGLYYFYYLPHEKERQRQADDAAAEDRAAQEQQRLAAQLAKTEADAAAAAKGQADIEAAKPPDTTTLPATNSPASTAPGAMPAAVSGTNPAPAGTVATDNAEAAGYRVKATAGDIVAARKLGILYYDGQGVPKDPVEALKWLQLAANQGDAEAQTRLGTMYFNGWGVTKDYAQAAVWHQKAADQGNAEGLNHLGAMYASGWGVAKDYDQAFKLIQKSADLGNADGEASLGTMYQSGLGVDKDYAQALKWFQKAASQGNAAAQSEMGIQYAKGLGVTKDYGQALICFQKAADQGDAAALVNIGDMYQNGWGLTKDYGQAMTFYQKAADQGDPTAQSKIGLMFLKGLGVTKDDVTALSWFQKAADQGNAAGQAHLGDMYENGLGVAKDYGQALGWYQKAADQGNADAQNNLGFIYQNGWGATQDYGQAMLWYQKAADQGDSAGQYNIGYLYAKGWGVNQDYGQAMTWLQKSATQGDGQAMQFIGEFYANGWGVNQDNTQAMQWYQKAVAAGDNDAASDIQKLKDAAKNAAASANAGTP